MPRETEYHNLLLTLTSKNSGIIRTNQITFFELVIKNTSDKACRGKIVLQWFSPVGMMNVTYNEVLILDPPLQPNESRGYTLCHDEELEGTMVCQVLELGSPQEIGAVDNGVLKNRGGAGGKVLYSYIVDEAIYQEEQRKHKEVLEKIDTMKDVISTTVLNQLKQEIYNPNFLDNLRIEYEKVHDTKEKSEKPQLEHFR